jgi:cytochrome P450
MKTKQTLPPCPRTPSFIQVYQWATRPTEFLENCAKEYGDIFTAKWPGYGITVFANHPQAIEHIFTAPSNTFSTGEIYEMLRPVVGNKSLMLLDGKPHRRQRSLVMPTLHGERVGYYGELICKLTQEMMEKQPFQEGINMSSLMQKLSLNIILQVVFGSEQGERLLKLRQKFREMLNCVSSPTISLRLFVKPLRLDLGSRSVWGRFLRLRNQVSQLLYEEINQRQHNSGSDCIDVLSMLMKARYQDGQPISNEELHDQVMTVLSGYESLATATLCSLYRLQKHPQVHQKLQQELNGIEQISDSKAIAKLPYLNAISKETMRMYPPVVVAMRVVKIPFQLAGYEFPVGSQVVADIYSTHHRQDLFPNPQQFKPERFLEKKFSAYEYLPFGGGDRRCLGYAFAPFQMNLVLATIVSNYKLQLVDNDSIKLVRNAAGVAPAKDIYMRIEANCNKAEATVFNSSNNISSFADK